MMKFLLIYLILFLFLWVKGSAIDRELVRTEDSVREEIVQGQTVSELSSLDIRYYTFDSYFLILKSLIPETQIDLSAGVDQSWNNLSYKILHGMQKMNIPVRLQMWYDSEFMRILSNLHVKGFFQFFLKKLII